MIQLIPTQKKTVEIDGAKFEISYATPAQLSEIYNRHTDRGQINTISATTDILTKYVHGWEGINDENGNPVAFDKNLLERLPLSVQTKLVNEITKYVTEETEEVEKNF